ncbi:MAG: UDP-N-acetylmuramoyl-L-alanine--D-glutamate ligase [Anaerolineales bacterium]|jgi:UDP-N-acetylmuramoylalanine--D-glutamate ligase
MMDWTGVNVVIIGAARQGTALARYLIKHGASVVLNDRRKAFELTNVQSELSEYPIRWVLGGHPLDLLEDADILCPSAGVPLSIPLIEAAKKKGIPLSNDSQIFLAVAPCKVIGITGSAGKTTTTTIVGRIAHESVLYDQNLNRAWIGGNIGTPLITYVDEMQKNDIAIIELSSFQLEAMTLSPQIAAVINITPNHLDRHGTMEAYTSAKARIIRFQNEGDIAVLNQEDGGSWSLSDMVQGRLVTFGRHKYPEAKSLDESRWEAGTFIEDDWVCLWDDKSTKRLISLDEYELKGEHNLLNLLAACSLAYAADFPIEGIRNGIVGFSGVPHRLEFIRSWGGADWYNDSIATAPERVIAAIRSFDEPLILLAGGRDKDLPWLAFADLVKKRVKQLILFGEAAEKIQKAILASKVQRELNVHMCSNLQEAVTTAVQIAEPGDVVLLSPGGTSFDEFNDFEERGDWFRKWVKNLS